MSHDDSLDIPCDKDELFENALVLHVLKPNTSAGYKHVIPIASAHDEQNLLSSLHTLGYIEFDDLCNLDCLEERIFTYADLSWLSRHSYHVIGTYNSKGQYMVHRVCICPNLNSSFVVQDGDRLEGIYHTNIFTCSSNGFVL
jgi:hypothetical protein